MGTELGTRGDRDGDKIGDRGWDTGDRDGAEVTTGVGTGDRGGDTGTQGTEATDRLRWGQIGGDRIWESRHTRTEWGHTGPKMTGRSNLGTEFQSLYIIIPERRIIIGSEIPA